MGEKRWLETRSGRQDEDQDVVGGGNVEPGRDVLRTQSHSVWTPAQILISRRLSYHHHHHHHMIIISGFTSLASIAIS